MSVRGLETSPEKEELLLQIGLFDQIGLDGAVAWSSFGDLLGGDLFGRHVDLFEVEEVEVQWSI